MSNMRSEALFLGDVLLGLLPTEPEVLGLCALMLFCESRVHARFTQAGLFVPLADQDTQLWNTKFIAQAEFLLRQATLMARPGAFQIEAAIQSAHSQRLFTGDTPWKAIVYLYEQLLDVAPSIGAEIALAVAHAQLGDFQGANAKLNAIAPQRVKTYQPFWVAQSYIARLAGDLALNDHSLKMAIGLTINPAIRQYLLQQQNSNRNPPNHHRNQK
jgi:RNA polymerase sigma-70 factor (ECF subfamily)